jgi:bifunctional UDP-N-acetylglucosamine pyrophosphorylase / glucosamine-1-phosphate N-acetyltransferase
LNEGADDSSRPVNSMIAEHASNDEIALVVLAAGSGTRMRSALPKPLHPIAGKPMLWHVLAAASAAEPVSTTVVVNPTLILHPAWVEANFGVRTVEQTDPRGTGDAVRLALTGLPATKRILILFADHPLLTKETVARLVARARKSKALVTMLTCDVDPIGSYGRVERGSGGEIRRVIERKDDDSELRRGAGEINSGMMVVDGTWARDAISQIAESPVTNEYYLPELVRIAAQTGDDASSWPVQSVRGEVADLAGVNDRVELAQADASIRERIRRRHLLAGVTLIGAETIFIDEDVEIGVDSVINPFSVLQGRTHIGARCEIGPHSVLRNARVADGVRVLSSHVYESSIAPGADVGPFSHLRSGASIGPSAHLGNFVEVKNSVIESDVRIGHVSYIGDAHIGPRTNIGAGAITCNFDGVAKHRSEIGEDVFIGSDTMLIAPVVVGDGARTGAGAVVTRDVPGGATVVGVPAHVIHRNDAIQADEKSGEQS